jgi:multidrug efflux pump
MWSSLRVRSSLRKKGSGCRSAARKSEKDILAVNFALGNRIIRLADIANVRREDADPPDPIFRINGKPGLGLALSMRDGGDVLALGQNVHEAMRELKKDLPVGIEPVMVADQPETVSHAISEFMEALWEAIAIVLVVSIVSLGFRAGSVVIVSIPLVLAAVFAAMQGFGIDLQRISLGALIIALGLLVDDAMITIESMVSRLERGEDKRQAAEFAYASTAMPRLTGTLVTIAGFVPVGFARSDAGEYTFSLFAVVAMALLASWIVSGLFAPVVGLSVLRPPKHAHGETLGAPMRLFKRVLLLAMRAKWITIGATIILFVAALAGTRLVPEQFFPSSDRAELLVDLKLQDNASILSTRDVVQQFDEIIAADPDVERSSTYVGQGAIRFYLSLDVALPNPFFAQAVAVTKGLKEREQVRARLEKTLPTRFPELVARIYPLELGPPVGWPVKYRVTGPDLVQVRSIALQVAELMGTTTGLRNVNFDWVEPARVLRIRVDQDQARQANRSATHFRSV